MPNSLWSTRVARAVGVGWSNTTVAWSRTPVSAVNRSRSSTAVRESNPRSRNARSGRTASGDPCPRTSAASARTTVVSRSTRSVPGSPPRAARRAAAASEPSWPGPGRVPGPVDSRIRVTSGSAVSSGLGRAAVNTGTKRSQSTSATVTVVSSWSSARWRAVIACSGARVRMPRSLRCSRSSSSTMPPSAHAPQAREVPTRPRALRCSTRASR